MISLNIFVNISRSVNKQSQADSLGHEDLNVKVLKRLRPTELLLSNIVNTQQGELVRRLGN